MPRIKVVLPCALAALAPSPALADVVKQGADSFVTRETRIVEAGPREVWMALISPDQV